ncbi:MAG: YciI family protein [Ferruginibacter sp.]
MEKFMLIFQGEISKEAKMSPDEMQANMGKWMAWIDGLAKAGKYVSGEPLLPGGKLIKGSAGNVTDGPYTEGKEIVGGYFIVNAANYDEAVELCKGFPDYDKGSSIQVRQVLKMEQPPC